MRVCEFVCVCVSMRVVICVCLLVCKEAQGTVQGRSFTCRLTAGTGRGSNMSWGKKNECGGLGHLEGRAGEGGHLECAS